MSGNETVYPIPDSNYATFNAANIDFLQNELPAILSRYGFKSFVFSGGVHGIISGKVSLSFSVDAFTEHGNRVTADGQGGSASIDYGAIGASDEDFVYVIASAEDEDMLGNFQRAGESNYFINCVDIPSSPPLLPQNSVWLMEVTISGGNITEVRDIRNLSPVVNTPVNVKDFGATGGGVTNDRVAIQAAFAASKNVFFPEGTYYLGDHADGVKVIDLSAYGGGIRIHTGGVVTISCGVIGVGAVPIMFYLEDNSNFCCDPICFYGHGLDTSTMTGACAIGMDNYNNINWGNITFEGIDCEDVLFALRIRGTTGVASTNRLHGIHISLLNISDCYYGLYCYCEGDDIFGNIVSSHCVQPYSLCGARDHAINVFNRNPQFSSGQCEIGTTPGSIDTKGIILNYTCRESTAEFQSATHILFQHPDLLGHVIDGVKINVNIHDSVLPYYPIAFKNYVEVGGIETEDASPNVIRNVQLSGSCDANALPISVVASYAEKGFMHFISSLNFLPSKDILDSFQLSQLERNQITIVWDGASGAPTLGDGILKYDMDISDGMVFLSIFLGIGSTTVLASGEWSFSGFLPALVKSTSNRQGSWYAVDSVGEMYFAGISRIGVGEDVITCVVNNSATLVDDATPHVWAPTDTLEISIAFPIS